MIEIGTSIGEIARDHLDVETLEMRGTEGQDVYQLHVDQIRRALLAAYVAGVRESKDQTGD